MLYLKMENSDPTISTKFFDYLWPQQLDRNECDIKTSNTSENLVPEKKFDSQLSHELLANKCYENFVLPAELECKPTSEKQTEKNAEEEYEQFTTYFGSNAKILPLDHQLAIIQQDVKQRQKLANDFANRTFPWYIQRPSYPKDFKITDEIKQHFKDPFEYKILQSLQRFRCHLAIIDVAPLVNSKNLERLLKFAPYVAIIIIIHDGELYENVKKLYNIFQPILMEANVESTWQTELERSINMGVEKAKELFLFEDISQPILFIFSHNRGASACNKFKMLRKSAN